MAISPEITPTESPIFTHLPTTVHIAIGEPYTTVRLTDFAGETLAKFATKRSGDFSINPTLLGSLIKGIGGTLRDRVEDEQYAIDLLKQGFTQICLFDYPINSWQDYMKNLTGLGKLLEHYNFERVSDERDRGSE